MTQHESKTRRTAGLTVVLALTLSGCVLAPADPYGYSYQEEVYLAPSARPIYHGYAPAPGYGRTYAPPPTYSRIYEPAPRYRWNDEDRRGERNRIDRRHDQDRGHLTPPPNRGKPPERDRGNNRDRDNDRAADRQRDSDRRTDRDSGNQAQRRLEQQRIGEENARKMRERVGLPEHETIGASRPPQMRDPGERGGWDNRYENRNDGRKHPRANNRFGQDKGS